VLSFACGGGGGGGEAHNTSVSYPASQVLTASWPFTQPKVPWRRPKAGPASQPLEKSPSQSQYLQKAAGKEQGDLADTTCQHVVTFIDAATTYATPTQPDKQ
jgi:hypothetical protein